jgi:hypothetical protein
VDKAKRIHQLSLDMPDQLRLIRSTVLGNEMKIWRCGSMDRSNKCLDVKPDPADIPGVVITPTLASPRATGIAVQFNAAGQGSSGYQYRFLLYNGTNWAVVQDYGAGSSWTLPANTPPGNYTLDVDVRTSTAVDRDAVAYYAYQIVTAQ